MGMLRVRNKRSGGGRGMDRGRAARGGGGGAAMPPKGPERFFYDKTTYTGAPARAEARGRTGARGAMRVRCRPRAL